MANGGYGLSGRNSVNYGTQHPEQVQILPIGHQGGEDG